MAKKASPSTTINPLHFEDLEPHRFEDLVRELIYDFKDWKSIEATGRAGSDEGFDIRAWEKVAQVTNTEEEETEENDTGSHPMEGNLWMVQCKREHELGPTKVSRIIDDGIKSDPPYGYILVASVNFSKKSYDTFREKLREKGVSEFYLWGKGELEDLLYLPKNDRVLFTFFGVSLATKRKSKSTERRFAVNNKNKLARILAEGEVSRDIYSSVLIRDINDENYPWEDRYADFEINPRWREFGAIEFHPRGLIFHVHKYYAYIDEEKREFDFTQESDLISRPYENQANMRKREKKDTSSSQNAEDFWKHFRSENRAYFVIDGLLPYEEMLVIDDKGDVLYAIPQIFVDPRLTIENLFRQYVALVKEDEKDRIDLSEYKRIKIFPDELPDKKIGKVYEDKQIQWDPETLRLFDQISNDVKALFDHDGKYDFLNVDDAILVAGSKLGSDKIYLRITQKFSITVKEYIEKHKRGFIRQAIERQVGKSISDTDIINVFEFEKAYEWSVRPKK